MSDDRTLPVLLTVPAGAVELVLRQQLAERTRAADLWRTVAARKQQTIDTQRALIEELTAERDKLRAAQRHMENAA